jgi:cytochrome P450
MTNATREPIRFDPLSEDYFEDPSATYRRLRDEAPVYRDEDLGFYALSRYAHVLQALRDFESYGSFHGVRLSDLLNPHYVNRSGMISMDPPEHDRMPKLVSRVFTPRAVLALEDDVRSIIVEHLDPLVGRPAFDVVADFSALFPINVISLVLGVPAEDRATLQHWFDLVIYREPGNPNPTPEGVEAYVKAHEYFHELAIEKRRHPGDDMMSRLCQVSVERDGGGTTQLTDAEISDFGVLLCGAGSETVTKLVGNGVVLFHQNPDQWQKVLDEPERIPDAVEEILRWSPPAEYVGRFTRRDVDIDGETIPAGSPVLLLIRAACNDERVYPEAERFDIDRDQQVNIGFGFGIHSCLGAALARLESRVTFQEIRRRWPGFRVDLEGCKRITGSNVAGYSNVPVLVDD